MTLQHYQPDQLDQLALRLLDSCGALRRLAERSREQEIDDFKLNDKKALEWLTNLEVWVKRSEDDLEMQIIKNRGAKMARQMRADGSQIRTNDS